MITLLALVSGITATILLCLHKWGVFEYYQVHRPEWLKWDICVFCIGFWISCLVTLVFYFLPIEFFTYKFLYIAVPFASASIVMVIYNGSIR